MFNLWFTKNDLKQTIMAVIAMILVIFLANESGLKIYLLNHISRPQRANWQGTLDVVFGTIGILIKKFFVRNEPIYVPATKATDSTGA